MTKKAMFKKGAVILGVTWFFWLMAFAFINDQMALGLIIITLIPSSILLVMGIMADYYAILLFPFSISALIVWLCYRYFFDKARSLSRKVFLANLVFMVSFFIWGEVQWRVELALAKIPENAECFKSTSFFGSFSIAKHEFQHHYHASYYHEGKMYLWSYKKMDFFHVPWSIAKNISSYKCRDFLIPDEEIE